MNIILCVDFGSTYTKLTAISEEKQEVLATSKSITSINTSIINGYNEALSKLKNELKEELNIKTILGCSSAAGGLKMVVIGNVQNLTAAAAKKAALGAGARVLKTYNFDLSNDEIKEIKDLKADIILLAGGTDGGNKKYIINNAKILSENKIKIPIVVAGNKSAQNEIKEHLDKNNCDYYITENLMPSINKLNIEPVRNTIRKIFIDTIIKAKGLEEAKNICDNEIIPTPLSILNAASILAIGSDTEEGIGELIVIDIGGATTDIHSVAHGYPSKGDVILKGLEEPFDKRTVEGDLGMRYSAQSLLEAVSTKDLKKYLKKINLELSDDEIKENIKLRYENINMIPHTKEELLFDDAMAMAATSLALKRHSGVVELAFSMMGQSFFQTGKDLTRVKTLIGTGGVIIHSNNKEEILKSALYTEHDPNSLKPMNPKTLIDSKYVLSALGLLKTFNEDLSVRMMKKYLIKPGDTKNEKISK